MTFQGKVDRLCGIRPIQFGTVRTRGDAVSRASGASARRCGQ
jgi:hypothetical protein